MLMQNVTALFKIISMPNNKTHNQDVLHIFIPNTDNPHLIFDELLYDESTKENCEKIIWKLFKNKNFIFTKHSFYDDTIINNETRLLQCATSCILTDDVQLDEKWFAITFLKDEIILTNNTKKFTFKYKIINNEIFIISSNVLFSNNHSKILIEILLSLKNIFNHTDIAFSLTSDKTPVKIASIINSFNHRKLSISTIERRFRNFF